MYALGSTRAADGLRRAQVHRSGERTAYTIGSTANGCQPSRRARQSDRHAEVSRRRLVSALWQLQRRLPHHRRVEMALRCIKLLGQPTKLLPSDFTPWAVMYATNASTH